MVLVALVLVSFLGPAAVVEAWVQMSVAVQGPTRAGAVTSTLVGGERGQPGGNLIRLDLLHLGSGLVVGKGRCDLVPLKQHGQQSHHLPRVVLVPVHIPPARQDR